MQRKGSSIFAVIFLSTVLGLLLLTVGGLWAAEPVAPIPAAAAPASRPFISDQDEAEIARRMADAGDPRIIPVALQWLATEQDGQPIRFGSPRFRAAVYVVQTLGVREAIPLLLAAYDSPTTMGDAKTRVAAAVIRIDPKNLDFCREVLADETPILRTRDNPGAAEASARLADEGDEKAMAFFIRGYTEFLQAYQIDQKVDTAFHRAVNRMSYPNLRQRLLQLVVKFPTDPAHNRLAIDAEIIRMNELPQEKRLAIALDAKEKESERFLALSSLGLTGGVEVLEALEKAERWSPDFKAGNTRPVATTRAAATTSPSRKAKAVATSKPSSGTTQWAIDQIRCRFRLGHSTETPPALSGITPDKPLADGESMMRLTALMAISDGVLTKRPVALAEPSGESPEILLAAAPPLIQFIQTLQPDAMVRVKIEQKTHTLLEIAAASTRPGELVPGGYVLIEKRTVRDGDVERLAVVLSKSSRQIVARVPNRNKPGGGVAPDKTMAKALDALKPGDVVLAQVNEPSAAGEIPMLVEIAPYQPALSAQFVRWIDAPEGAATVEVTVGREKRTYLMPEPRETLPVAVAPELRGRFWEGCRVRIRPQSQTAQTPARLSEFDVEGFVEPSADGSHVTVHAGGASLQGDPKRVPFYGMVGAHNTPSDFNRARIGINKFLTGKGDLPGEITPDVREKLTELAKPEKGPPGDLTNQLNHAFERTQAADKMIRRTAEQELYLGLQRFSFDRSSDQRRKHDEVVGLLTPEQYRAAVTLGQLNIAPKPPATRPAVRPGPASRPAKVP